MEALNKKARSLETIDFGSMRIGDWELNTYDPLSPSYESWTAENIFLRILNLPMTIYHLFIRG